MFLGTAKENTNDAVEKGMMKGARGERNGSAKLTAEQVADIRVIYADGKLSYSRIGKIFNVCGGTIHDIVKRKKWAHVA